MPRFNPLPACPIPIQFDVDSRIKELQTMIDGPTTSEEQKTNLRAAIDLYNKRVLPGPWRLIQDGQLSSQAAAPSLCSAPSESSLSQQLAHRVAYNPYPAGHASGHEIFARIRQIPSPASPSSAAYGEKTMSEENPFPPVDFMLWFCVVPSLLFISGHMLSLRT
ncbi:hypothetical protein CIRG_00021 [Coccidioides immitis RMSCC 2394]|uniref:Uncharacterized protein n=1 Tax=Coccidioides immitis RMSCC 2394 TaxID=404692 RepID=A0A0J6XYQ3_COCIT|nr:hypothetical protein CIRG_00021 [Coccidioides immitis RMSCC 2394]